MRILIAIFVIFTIYGAHFFKLKKFNVLSIHKSPIDGIKHRPNPKIIGGHEAEPHSIPYEVFLEVYKGLSGWYCAGSLISQNYVLTSANCVYGATEIYVTLGAHKPLEAEDTQVTIISDKVKIHENFNANLIINDIAVIELSEPTIFNDNIDIVSLPNRSDVNNTYVGSTARISGWGLTSSDDGDISGFLNYVDVTIISNGECQLDFSIYDSNICTDGDFGFCNGDTGGPLVVENVLIGLVSYGVPSCARGSAAAFTRVTSYLAWIEANTDVQISH